MTTTKDVITPILSLDDFRAAVLPVDNARKAGLLVTASGQYWYDCSPSPAYLARTVPTVTKTAAGWDVVVSSGWSCKGGQDDFFREHVVAITFDGVTTVKQTKDLPLDPCLCGCPGRRPEGLAPVEASRAANVVGRFFADASHLEGASVVAFERLADELAALGAPADLVTRAHQSRDDEVRHARMTATIATRFDAEVAVPEVAPAEARSAFDVALENAVEGCVNETWAALVAHWQAHAAGDDRISAVMRGIAVDVAA